MTYVEVATRHFGRRGRPTNVSRTAMLTGLARRDVRKQRELLENGAAAPLPSSPRRRSCCRPGICWNIAVAVAARR